MWQRLQTLYLAVATGLVVALFFSVKAFALGPQGVHAEEYTYVQNFPYAVLLGVITLLQLIAVFTFNFRVFQMRTATLSAILLVALQAWLVFDWCTCADGLVFKYTAIFPIVAVILDALAIRLIVRDQLLVESITRLRSRKKNHR
ncbi:MAG: DUF4293 domain-containing protein [Bacteroidales bacterium]|nr:DUF4293 domain-containing protein [Bacteroidales bacterium]